MTAAARSKRFTPTRVGKSQLDAAAASSAAVHPHVCGEIEAGDKSSTRRAVHPHACGEIACRRRATLGPAVHPHACGEIVPVCVPILLIVGSPPRVWGNHELLLLYQEAYPVHPHACGEICQRSDCRRRCAVHPHACGEIMAPGSPGRAPGRFTPTRVGKSYSRPLAIGWSTGSPPRVWGNRYRCGAEHELHRFTPTRVGKSLLKLHNAYLPDLAISEIFSNPSAAIAWMAQTEMRA